MSFQIYLQRTPALERIFLHCFCKTKFIPTISTAWIQMILGKKKKWRTYMRILRGSSKAKNSEQNLCTEAKELRSISNRITSAFGLSFWIFSITSFAFFKSLAPITTLTPLFANTLAVSAPIPEVAPSIKNSTTIK